MQIAINDQRKIFEIQEEFQLLFPFLKIEFFTLPRGPGMPSAKKMMQPVYKKLSDCRTLHHNGTITITPHITVTELEQQFNAVYGLSVQVFRKSGRVWLETTATDGWTLKEQNDQGKALSEKGKA